MILPSLNRFNTATLALTALLGMVSLASCSQSPNAKLESTVAKAIENLPTNPEFPALNAEMLQALSADVPELRPRLAAIERSEKANLARAATLMQNWAKEGEPADDKARPQAAQTPVIFYRRSAKFDPLGWLVPPAHAQDMDMLLTSVSGYSAGSMMANMVGRGSDGETGSETRSIDGPDGEKVTITRDAQADGTMSISIESNVDVVPLGVVGGTKMSLSAKTFCPDVNGRVEFTIKMDQKASAKGLGSLAKQSGTLEAIVEVTTNERGDVASTAIKTKYDRKSSGASGASSASGSAGWTVRGSDIEMTGQSKGSTNGEAGAAHESNAAASAAILGSAAASGASSYWQNGNCVKIDADAPYRPKPGATTEMPVAVKHKQDGSSIPARVDAKLDGGKSLSPVVIRRAPGSLTHISPDKAGVSMSIVLQARSRRGSAREVYNFRTADQCYNIEGGGGEFKGDGSTCDLTQPFTVEGNANIVVNFTPTDANGGTYSYTGNISGAKLSGKGTYTVQYNGEVPVGIKGSGPGTACTPMGCFTSPGTEKYTLTPQ